MGSKIGLHDLTNGTMLNLIKPDNTGNIDITLPTENGSLITSEKVDEKIERLVVKRPLWYFINKATKKQKVGNANSY